LTEKKFPDFFGTDDVASQFRSGLTFNETNVVTITSKLCFVTTYNSEK
jgi:hypothetical protein